MKKSQEAKTAGSFEDREQKRSCQAINGPFMQVKGSAARCLFSAIAFAASFS
jgi:hypothetical protein